MSEDEDDCFFESLDRIPSTSGSDTEDDFRGGGGLRKPLPPATNFAANFGSLDALSCSVEERRQRLLRQFGLNDNGGSGAQNSRPDERRFAGSVFEVGRSVSTTDGWLPPLSPSGKSSVAESASAISTSNNNVDSSFSISRSAESNSNANVNSNSRFNLDSRSNSLGDRVSSNNNNNNNNNKNNNNAASGRIIEREISSNSDSSSLSNLGTDAERSGDSNPEESTFCLVKNLDTGKEFIVNSVSEDGMWSKLKEVETGRELSMEEFERVLGHSPLVQELMRRERAEQAKDKEEDGNPKRKKKGGWLKSIKVVADNFMGHKVKVSSDEKDTSSEKGGRRSSSATDDSQDILLHHPQWTKVHQYGKNCKEFSAMYMGQEIQAHCGPIWAIRFSGDGRYLATAGQDGVIHVWQVTESERKYDNLVNEKSEDGITRTYVTGSGNGTSDLLSLHIDGHPNKKKKGKTAGGRKSTNLESILLPENLFLLSDKPNCSFHGHSCDILDLSWSQSQYLLSSSMDKTVRLWHMPSQSCLRVFTHNDFVTCLQFNPVDDRFFISGSLDKKVRIWSIPDRQIVDWTDLHEMITAVCYTPDGQAAYVGTNIGNCYHYNTLGNKLQEEIQINVQNKRQKARGKKITGFQFSPGSSQKVLISSADSRIRVFDGSSLVKKYKGLKNLNSQISASFTGNGKYVISASENSYVYIWNYDCRDTPAAKNQGVCQAYEYFVSRHLYTVVPWLGLKPQQNCVHQDDLLLRGIAAGRKSSSFPLTGHLQDGDSNNGDHSNRGKVRKEIAALEVIPNSLPLLTERHSFSGYGSMILDSVSGPPHGGNSTASSIAPNPLQQSSSNHGILADSLSKGSATWPEEKLPSVGIQSQVVPHAGPYGTDNDSIHQDQSPAWGLVFVTAGHDGKLRTFQNYGWPSPLK